MAMKRVNVIIPEEYYSEIQSRGLKLSGVVRDALEDQLNPNTVTISVSEKTHELYMQIFSESNCQDSDFEPYLKKALQSFIDEIIDNKVEKLKALKDKLE